MSDIVATVLTNGMTSRQLYTEVQKPGNEGKLNRYVQGTTLCRVNKLRVPDMEHKHVQKYTGNSKRYYECQRVSGWHVHL